MVANDTNEVSTNGQMVEESNGNPSKMVTALKLVAASAFLTSAASLYAANGSTLASGNSPVGLEHRRLASVEVGDSIPSYMQPLMKDLEERKKLMEETPPEEVKYWFEYTGPLQKYFYRYSKSRQKADYFEGRDDSGVLSERFVEEAGGGEYYTDFLTDANVPENEISSHARLLENCLAMGNPTRPSTGKGTLWNDWFGSKKSPVGSTDRCRILFTMNTVGAGRGTTMLWETNPPRPHSDGPKPWISEQETAATHIQRNLEEIDAMCATGQIAARLQVLVCEPIPALWTEWMDSLLVNCGGKAGPLDQDKKSVEERPSPVQVVVVAGASTADTCHDQKSGFMEKRMQDLVIAPPYLSGDKKSKDPTVKTTHRDLVSSDDHDMYVAFKWSSLVSTRSVNAFVQASADLAAAAASPNNQKAAKPEKNADGVTVSISNSPSSPFLIPSFVRVSYVSEENSKVAKWRMHGDFFHPAAWEVCKDSFDMTWVPDSLSGAGGVNGICNSSAARKSKDCGQWWVYMAEEQMSVTPEVYANEATPPIVQGGSNNIWMATERQRRELVKQMVCKKEEKDECGQQAQAVIPLGDLESFFINFTPNTALGKQHIKGRRPGYSREKEREMDREKVRERKQLKGQEDIEKALFDYTVYPAALFHKDATIKAVRARDAVVTKSPDKEAIGPQTVKSSYYDVTITKPREATLAWCQAISRNGLCTLYADYFRTSSDVRCLEACGMMKNFGTVKN
mmetsp:Transcript_22239/g.30980  ORF Transcript_22239/g.30980 Transcript_22239/m.30980 type:complete len:738 (+) Transcript_22239:102-2315(+)